MTEVYIGIGANIGNRKKYIADAIGLLKASEDIKIDKTSPIYETDPIGGPPQDRFLNGVIKIKTRLSPRALLIKLKAIEDSLGRKRTIKNGPRTIDLDILTYGDLKVQEKDLEIPHPRMGERDFVRHPLNDLLSESNKKR